ncbi:MAG: hypothetical protein ACTHM1_00780 [Solirubrobacteraceae bacterium]
MSPTITNDTRRRSRPRLRLLHDDREQRLPREEESLRPSTASAADTPAAPSEPATVLIAGAHPQARARMRRQLGELLPQGTPFVEAGETWEVVARAPSSRLVVVAGDLDDLSARGLMRVLSRRHPLLPVIAVGGCTDDAGAPRAGAASL